MTQEDELAGFDEFLRQETARESRVKKMPPVSPPIIQTVPQVRPSIVRYEHRFQPGNVFACTLASIAAIIVVFVLLGFATLALGLLPLLLRRSVGVIRSIVAAGFPLLECPAAMVDGICSPERSSHV
jgi:hypothetical protein